MPQYGYESGFDTVSYVTGPSHVMLGIRFSTAQLAPLGLIKRPGIGSCEHASLDELKIAQAIRAGVRAANAKHGTKLAIAQAFYVENDSPRYELFEQCAFLLASRRSRCAE